MLNKVVLPYTIWYTGLEKILRLNLDKTIDTVTNISTKATLNGTSVNDLVSAIFNPSTKSIDITIRSDARMDVDGEMEISLSYSDAKTHESILVVSVRSHEKIATEKPKEVKQTKLTLRNGQSYTVGAADEQVVYSFNLVDRNVTDEFATYGDVKDMLIGLGVTDNGEKDQYTIILEGDNLVLTKENDSSYRKVINLAKYHDEVSGEPLNVEDLKRDILSIVDGKLPNVETLKSDILAEAATKDTQLKADILHEVDGKIPNGDTIKQDILADVNPRIPDKETLKTEILESAGEKDTALKTAILEEVGTRTTANNQSLKQEIMGEVDSKLPNTAVLKENILGEVDTKITTNNQTFKSTVMSEVDAKIPDVSVVKSEILNEVNPRLLDKETFKQEILSAIPAPANYTLTMEEDNLVLGKEGDDSYRKVINLSKYRDEVTGQTVDVEQIKKDILAAITIPKAETIKEEILQSLPTIPNYTLTLNENTLTLGKEGDSEYAKTIDLSKYSPLLHNDTRLYFIKQDDSYHVITLNIGEQYNPDNDYRPILVIPFTSLRELPKAASSEPVTIEKILELLKDESKKDILTQIKEKLHVPDEATIKQNILAEVNPKLIDKDTFKQEILSALPAKDEYSLELTEDTLVLTKTNDSSYRKEINLAKYHDEVGQPINVDALKSDILSQVDTKISAIPKHTVTAVEILDTLAQYGDDGDFSKFLILAGQLLISLSDENRLVFRKTETSYEIVFDADGIGGASPLSTSILTIPFSSLRELPTPTQSDPVTLEKILELLKDESKASVVGEIAEKLGITRPPSGSSLIISPVVENGVFKPNPHTEVDFTNDFYTKAKVDALLSNTAPSAPSGPIEGHGRPDKKPELANVKIGTTYVDLDKTDGAYIWMKKSKWTVVEGDTGEVDFEQTIFGNNCKIRRVNDTVIINPKATDSIAQREILDITFEQDHISKTIHISNHGWTPITKTSIPITWIYDESQSISNADWSSVISDMTDKYVPYTGRVIFNKSLNSDEFDIKVEPDFGIFSNEINVEERVLSIAKIGYVRIIYQQFIYQTDDVWPELSK